MMGHFSDSDVEFDGKYNTNVEFRDSGSADGVSNWNELAPPPKSSTTGTNNSMRNGMGWLCIDVDMFQFLLQRLPQYSLLESSLQPFCCTRMSLKTHMAERSPLLLCIISTKGTSFVFATHCLFIFLHLVSSTAC